MRNFFLILILALFAVNCAPKPTSIDLSKARASFELESGGSISDPVADDYSPVLVSKPDGTVVLAFSSDRDCGCATPGAYHVFIAESTEPIYYDGFDIYMPTFYDPVVVTSMGSELIVDPRSNLSATWNADQLLIYMNTGGFIQKQPIDAANLYLGLGNTLVSSGNSNHDGDFLMGFNHKEYKAISWNPGGVSEADFLNTTAGTSINNDRFYTGDSVAQVPSLFTGFLDSYFVADGGYLYVGTQADDYGEHEDFNLALDYNDLYLSTISVHSSFFHSTDVVVFSAGEGGSGAQHDLYLVSSQDASALWDLTFVHGSDFEFNPGPYRIFVSSMTVPGAFGAPQALDYACIADPSSPDVNVFYQVMMGAPGLRDGATGTQIDWVLSPLESYIKAGNGAVIGVADANAHLPFGVAFGTGATVWTGLTTTYGISANHCTNWSNTGSASVGDPTSTTSTAISTTAVGCGTAKAYYCVEQP